MKLDSGSFGSLSLLQKRRVAMSADYRDNKILPKLICQDLEVQRTLNRSAGKPIQITTAVDRFYTQRLHINDLLVLTFSKHLSLIRHRKYF